MSAVVPTQPVRSSFVTALAWVFIVLAGFATLISVLQNIMIHMMFPVAEMQAAADQATNDERMPWFAAFMFRNMRLFFLAFLVISAGTLASAVGLLKRKDWARIMFIGLMIFGILWSIGGVVLSIVLFSSIPPVPSTAPQGFADQFDLISRVMIGFNIVLGIGLAVVFGWIAKRLGSSEIRHEFSAA